MHPGLEPPGVTCSLSPIYGIVPRVFLVFEAPDILKDSKFTTLWDVSLIWVGLVFPQVDTGSILLRDPTEDSAESHTVQGVEKPKGAFGLCVCLRVCRAQCGGCFPLFSTFSVSHCVWSLLAPLARLPLLPQP